MTSSKTQVSGRLEQAKASLDYLELERSRRADPEFGRLLEDKLVWRELLELELQEAEERIAQLCDAAERALALIG